MSFEKYYGKIPPKKSKNSSVATKTEEWLKAVKAIEEVPEQSSEQFIIKLSVASMRLMGCKYPQKAFADALKTYFKSNGKDWTLEHITRTPDHWLVVTK